MVEISNITPAAIPVTPVNQSVNVASVAAVSNQQAAVSTATLVIATSDSNTNASVSESEKELTLVAVRDAAEVGNALLHSASSIASASRNLQFQVDEVTNQVIVKVVDSKTGEVVRQIPTVEMLDFIHAMKELEGNTGKLYQAKA